jgi:hypothetical protein
VPPAWIVDKLKESKLIGLPPSAILLANSVAQLLDQVFSRWINSSRQPYGGLLTAQNVLRVA